MLQIQAFLIHINGDIFPIYLKLDLDSSVTSLQQIVLYGELRFMLSLTSDSRGAKIIKIL